MRLGKMLKFCKNFKFGVSKKIIHKIVSVIMLVSFVFTSILTPFVFDF
jgi:hypothetical protein